MILMGLALPNLGKLAHAAGAAKVQRRGTGHNAPTRNEVQAVLEQFGVETRMLGSVNHVPNSTSLLCRRSHR